MAMVCAPITTRGRAMEGKALTSHHSICPVVATTKDVADGSSVLLMTRTSNFEMSLFPSWLSGTTLWASLLAIPLLSNYVSSQSLEPETQVLAVVAAIIFVTTRLSAAVWESAAIDITGTLVVMLLALSFLWYSVLLEFCGSTALWAASLAGVDTGHRPSTGLAVSTVSRRLTNLVLPRAAALLAGPPSWGLPEHAAFAVFVVLFYLALDMAAVALGIPHLPSPLSPDIQSEHLCASCLCPTVTLSVCLLVLSSQGAEANSTWAKMPPCSH